jgi:hypothetical protein
MKNKKIILRDIGKSHFQMLGSIKKIFLKKLLIKKLKIDQMRIRWRPITF